MAGSWQGTFQGITVRLVVTPQMGFSEQQIMGQLMTMQSGEIRAAGPGLVAFVVEDWQPRTMPRYHPTGTVGGYYTQEPMAKPPGGVWRITFQGADAMTMQDARLGGVILMRRVR
jgi:hypothetical protein